MSALTPNLVNGHHNRECLKLADSVEKLSGSATSLRFGDVFKIGGLTPCRMAAATSPRYRRPMPLPPPLAASRAAIGQVVVGFALSPRAGTRPWRRMAHAGAMGEQHLDLFSAPTGRFIFWRPNERPSSVAGIFVHIARNLPRHRIRAALRFACAGIAIQFAGAVTAHAVGVDARSRRGIGAPELNQPYLPDRYNGQPQDRM